MEPILQIRNLRIDFPTNQVVQEVSLDLYPGEILALVGASGAGKSVLAHAIMGILPKTATQQGTILYQGAPLTREAVVKNLVFLPQTSTYLDPLMKLGQQIVPQPNELGAKSAPLYPFQCSGGMIRNALFGLAYEKDATVILADEPTPGLDLDTALATLSQLQALAQQGKAVLLITHDIDLALHIAHRVAVFSKGKVLDVTTPRALAENHQVHPYTRALFDALPQNHFPALTPPPPMGASALVATDLGFRYPCKRLVFSHVSFALHQGQRIALLAKSGFGKSTFARVLAGYANPFQGRVLLDGCPLPRRGFSPVQLIAQHPETSVNPKWTVAEILNEGGACDAALRRSFAIDDSWLSRYPHQLSGGELQRICIARALKPGTRFLLCDEITTMLDPVTQGHIWRSLCQEATARNIGLLVITHNQALAQRICQTVIEFEQLCKEEP